MPQPKDLERFLNFAGAAGRYDRMSVRGQKRRFDPAPINYYLAGERTFSVSLRMPLMCHSRTCGQVHRPAISSCRLSNGNIKTDYIDPVHTSANLKPP
jgi:hypothetical protein